MFSYFKRRRELKLAQSKLIITLARCLCSESRFRQRMMRESAFSDIYVQSIEDEGELQRDIVDKIDTYLTALANNDNL